MCSREQAKTRLKQIAYEYGIHTEKIDRCSDLIDELDLEVNDDSDLSTMIKICDCQREMLFREIDEIVDGIKQEDK